MISGNKGKVVAASFLGKAKTFCMMIGLALVMLNNFPFTYLNVPVDIFLVMLATLLSIVSGCEYYYNTRYLFFQK